MTNTAKHPLLIACMICLSVVSGPLHAVAQTDEDPEMTKALADQGITQKDLNTCFMYYYKDPRPALLLKSVKVMLSLGSFVADRPHIMPMVHLVATAARANPALLKDLKDLETNYAGVQKEVVAAIIAQAEEFVSPPAISPAALDYLWGEFIATGAAEPVLKIMRVLEDHPSPDLDKQIVQNAAIWSLTANARQHKKVFGLIEQEAATAAGTYKETLEGMLSRVKEAAASKGPYPEPE